MKENKVVLKETIELFVNNAMREIKSEYETPNFNIIFPPDAIELFEYVKKYPFKMENAYTPNIKEEDIERLKPENNKEEDAPTIIVKDTYSFFNYLTEITNSLIRLYNVYGSNYSARALEILLMRRIWLRMGITDFNNVEEFLNRQLQFIKNDALDEYKFEKKFTEFYNYDVYAKSNLNKTWDETNRNMSFEIKDKEGNIHSLPHIHYDITEDNICYIYGIQNDRIPTKIKNVERKLYKLNKDIEEPNVHPSQVYSMALFIDLLKRHNITKIRVPGLQVLSYRYHELLSEDEKKSFPKIWDATRLDHLKHLTGDRLKYQLMMYENDKIWYNNIVDKQDLISKNKTENLINLFYRMTEHITDLEIRNDINVQGDYLDIRIGKEKSK